MENENGEETYHPVYAKPPSAEDYQFEKIMQRDIHLFKTKYNCFIGYSNSPKECIIIRLQSLFCYYLHPYVLEIDENVLEQILHRHRMKCTLRAFFEELVSAIFKTKLYAFCFTTHRLEHGVSSTGLPIEAKSKSSSIQWEKDGDYLVIQFKIEKEKAIALHEAYINEKQQKTGQPPENIIRSESIASDISNMSSTISNLTTGPTRGPDGTALLTAKPYMFVLPGYHQKRELKDIIHQVLRRFDEYKDIYEQQRLNEERMAANRRKQHAKK